MSGYAPGGRGALLTTFSQTPGRAPLPVPAGASAAPASDLEQLLDRVTAESDADALIQALTAELAQITGGGRTAVLLLDDTGWLRRIASHGTVPSGERHLDVQLVAEPAISRVLHSGEVTWSPPGVGQVLASPMRRAFRSGRSLLFLPLPHGRPGARGIALIEGVPAELGAAQLRSAAAVAAQIVVLARCVGLVESAGEERARKERVGLATELHDGVLQQLFAVQLKLRELEGLLPVDGPRRAAFDRVAGDVSDISRELRNAVVGLTVESPGPRAGLAADDRIHDLESEIENSLKVFAVRSDISWDLSVRGGSSARPSAAASALFLRTVREGLMNVHKHAQATQVLIVVRRGPEWWTVEVHDDGLTDANTLRRKITTAATTFGLRSLHEAANRSGGRVWIGQSAELEGVQLSISLAVTPVP